MVARCCLCKMLIKESEGKMNILIGFPVTPEWRKKWFEALKNTDVYYSIEQKLSRNINPHICSLHFDADSFEHGRLKMGAIPTKYLNYNVGPPPLIPVEYGPFFPSSSSMEENNSLVESDAVPTKKHDEGPPPLMPIEYDQFFHGNSSSSIGESSSLVPHETSLQQPYHLKHVCTFEAKTLRDLIVEETSRPLDQDVNLTSPTNQPSQLVNWQRLQRMYRTNRLYIRMTKRYGEPVVLLMYPEDEHRFSFFSSDLQDVQNWSLVPPFVKSLINTQETGSDTGDYATYALLVCNNFHGWELAGCISALAPTKQQSISPAVVSFPKMKRAILPPAPHSSSSSSSMAVSTTQFYSPISDDDNLDQFDSETTNTCTAPYLPLDYVVPASPFPNFYGNNTEMDENFLRPKPPNETSKWQRCDYCNFTSRDSTGILNHISRVHPRMRSSGAYKRRERVVFSIKSKTSPNILRKK